MANNNASADPALREEDFIDKYTTAPMGGNPKSLHQIVGTVQPIDVRHGGSKSSRIKILARVADDQGLGAVRVTGDEDVPVWAKMMP